MWQLEVTNAWPTGDDYGDDYEIRVKSVASSIVVVAGVVDRNGMETPRSYRVVRQVYRLKRGTDVCIMRSVQNPPR